MDHCIGKGNYHNNEDVDWYCFNDIPASKDTRCEYCYRNMEEAFDPRTLQLIAPGGRINCDSVDDPELSSMETHGFSVQILSSDKEYPYLVVPETKNLRDRNLLVVDAPKRGLYCIKISDLEKTPGRFYTAQLFVNGRCISPSSYSQTYYQGRIIVKGPSDHDLFQFDGVDVTVSIRISVYQRTDTTTDRRSTPYSMVNPRSALGGSDPMANLVNSLIAPIFSGTNDMFANTINSSALNVSAPYTTSEPKFKSVSGFIATIRLVHRDQRQSKFEYNQRKIDAITEEQDRMLEEQKALLSTLNITQVPFEPTPVVCNVDTQTQTQTLSRAEQLIADAEAEAEAVEEAEAEAEAEAVEEAEADLPDLFCQDCQSVQCICCTDSTINPTVLADMEETASSRWNAVNRNFDEEFAAAQINNPTPAERVGHSAIDSKGMGVNSPIKFTTDNGDGGVPETVLPDVIDYDQTKSEAKEDPTPDAVVEDCDSDSDEDVDDFVEINEDAEYIITSEGNVNL